MTRKVEWEKAAELAPERLAHALEVDHDEVDDGPEATDEQLAASVPGKRRPGQRGPGKRPAKVLLTARVDADVLDAWKATGDGWRSRINDVLRDTVHRNRSGSIGGEYREKTGVATLTTRHRDVAASDLAQSPGTRRRPSQKRRG